MNRRAYPRYIVSCPVDFSVQVLGSQFLVERFNSSGRVLDISRAGLLAEIDRRVAVDTDCVVSLVNAESLVWPCHVRGKVRRSSMGHAGWKIAVQFDSLIDLLPQVSCAPGVSEAQSA